MKFVTVMDMWLLILNICMLGGAFYFGRKLLKTMTRLMHVGEQRDQNAERMRCIRLIEAELEHYQTIENMDRDGPASEVVVVLRELLSNIRRDR